MSGNQSVGHDKDSSACLIFPEALNHFVCVLVCVCVFPILEIVQSLIFFFKEKSKLS